MKNEWGCFIQNKKTFELYLILVKPCECNPKGFLHRLIVVPINERIQSTVEKDKVILDICQSI